MQNFKNVELFNDYSLQDLFRQVVGNSRDNRRMLMETIDEAVKSINDTTDLQIMSPEIDKNLQLMVKNDELLIKLANAITKLVKQHKGLVDQDIQLTEQQKQQLMKEVDQNIKPLLRNINQNPIKYEKANTN